MSAEEIHVAIDAGAIIDGKSIMIWLLWQRKQGAGVIGQKLALYYTEQVW